MTKLLDEKMIIFLNELQKQAQSNVEITDMPGDFISPTNCGNISCQGLCGSSCAKHCGGKCSSVTQ